MTALRIQSVDIIVIDKTINAFRANSLFTHWFKKVVVEMLWKGIDISKWVNIYTIFKFLVLSGYDTVRSKAELQYFPIVYVLIALNQLIPPVALTNVRSKAMLQPFPYQYVGRL